MGNLFFNMKFTSLAVAALFLANSSAVLLRDDCNGKWCNKGLSYDLDEGTLRKAEAHNVAATQHKNGATTADNNAAAAHDAATAAAGATGAADAAAGQAKAGAAAAFAGADYKDRAAFKAADDERAKELIHARKSRDLAASTAAKAASDANLKANQDRVAYEKDQLVKGEDQDRLKFTNEATAAKTSEIQGKHDERERANGRLLKALASF